MELQTTNEIALREPLKLTSENVEAIFKDCLAESDEKIRQIISGVRIKAGFNRDKVTANRDNILSMLSCLPKEFHAFKGGGWTFLNLCVDADGRQWTDFHQMCDMLVCLGIAIGAVKFLLAREFWQCFPGGMPYVVVDIQQSDNQSS